MPEPFELSVAEAATLIRQRTLSPVDLMESLLSRARALEPALLVWVTLDEDAAMDAARRSEAELQKEGPRGPLHGVPVGVKDIFYTEGVTTTACSSIYADFVPAYDATAVARLKQAGAIIMGKTVTTEFACGDPPPTRNLWNAAHTPGGSSSGSAVGVVARIFPAALGSQTGGSVLRPASYNGVVGLKPTFGRISRHGVFAVAESLDTMGFFVRSVEDAAIVLGALSGHDPNDSASSSEPVPDYAAAVDADSSPPRVGLVGRLFDDSADAEVRGHMEGVVARLGDMGAAIEEANVPTDFDALLDAHGVIMSVEGATAHRDDFGSHADDYGPKVRALIEKGLSTPAVTYVEAMGTGRAFRRDMTEAMKGFDVLLTPSTPTPAPRDLTTTGDPMFQSPWTTGGFPTVTLPSGLSESGLPLGVQLAATSFDEEGLLAAARWCEQVLDVTLSPPV